MKNQKVMIGVGIGVGIAVVVAIIALTSVPTDPVSQLRQIVQNEDCVKLSEWEPNLYRKDLEVPRSLLSQAYDLAFKCEAQALANAFGK
jgi:hypothetical protein